MIRMEKPIPLWIPVSLTAIIAAAIFAYLTLAVDPACAASPNSVLSDLRKRYRKITTLQAKFKEIFRWELTGETVIREGALIVTKDNRFRIDTPEQLLVSNGREIYRYSPAKQQVIIERVSPDGKDQMLPSRLLLDFAEGFEAVGMEALPVDDKNGFRLDLTAQKPEDVLLKQAVIWVTADDLVVHRLKMIDLNGNTTTYNLSDVIIDSLVDSSTTSFSPPAGAEIFDLR